MEETSIRTGVVADTPGRGAGGRRVAGARRTAPDGRRRCDPARDPGRRDREGRVGRRGRKGRRLDRPIEDRRGRLGARRVGGVLASDPRGGRSAEATTRAATSAKPSRHRFRPASAPSGPEASPQGNPTFRRRARFHGTYFPAPRPESPFVDRSCPRVGPVSVQRSETVVLGDKRLAERWRLHSEHNGGRERHFCRSLQFTQSRDERQSVSCLELHWQGCSSRGAWSWTRTSSQRRGGTIRCFRCRRRSRRRPRSSRGMRQPC